ncbi:hypothetical protein IGI04_007955 [Brassica rapa subsp. trilocularis]|uniref:Uncharacterized protein n=1 Tax=Brassica rapa subsp. trilocularis TaxID=1813537 RepID=A0ABQ7NNB4_BRACM|nr:hypothetical protein IGI04_007955 [Brassica rapa subsp. trilocularis]
MYPSREGVAATDNSRRDRNRVLPSRLVDMEKDYLALDKRHPQGFLCPLSFPSELAETKAFTFDAYCCEDGSFKHDYTEDGGVDVKYTPTKSLAVQTGGKTMILMSGLSRTAWEDLASDKLFEYLIYATY